MLHGKRVLLGITGGIAAYKAAELLRELTRRGADVRVVMTVNAARFVGPLTFQALSGHPVALDMWAQEGIGHIDLARGSDLVIVAPASANVVGKMAAGLADDLLSTLLLAVTCPVVVAPAMNDRMYASAAVQSNLSTLRRRGVRLVEPGTGPLACGDEGQGRLAPLGDILLEAERALGIVEDMAGLSVVVTAGPTREAIDPVRYLSNRSSGKMGVALARRAAVRGAQVTLVLGPGTVEPPAGVSVVRVESARDMAAAAIAAAEGTDLFVAAAAVADWTPAARPRAGKIKKTGKDLSLTLVPTQDILGTLGRKKRRPFLVGFAAETGDPVPEGRRKLKAKGADLVVANDVSRTDSGFDADAIQVVLVSAGAETRLPLLPKEEAADRILDRALALRSRRGAG